MPALNKTILIGHLGKDPEIRYTANGKAVASMSLATAEKFGDREQTEWHRLVMWERLAEIANEYLHKGSLVYIEGRIQYRSYEDRDGKERHVTEIVVNKMLMLDKKGSTGGGSGGGGGYQQRGSSGGGSNYGPPPGDDDLPF